MNAGSRLRVFGVANRDLMAGVLVVSRRSDRFELARVLNSAQAPVYVVDDRRRLVFCNDSCRDWLNVDTGLLLGKQCDYHSETTEDPLQNVATALCPPPEAMAGQRISAVASVIGVDGRQNRRNIDFIPLGDDPLDCVGVVAIVRREEPSVARDDVGAELTPTQIHDQLRRQLLRERQRYDIQRLVGESAAIRRVRSQMELAASGCSRVLLVGPPGSGREHLARSLHYAEGVDSSAPLVPIDGPVLDAELLDAVIGAFLQRCAELTDRPPGALLLLEADQLSPDAQKELMAMLDIAQIEFRVLATSRIPLTELAAQGGYRADLAQALSTLVVELPPLADRPEDIEPLAQLFLESHNAAGKKQLGGFTPEAVDLMVAYNWPNNADELYSSVAAAFDRAEGPLVSSADMTELTKIAEAEACRRVDSEPVDLPAFLDDVERELIQRAMKRAKGNKTRAAQMLGINRARLLRRLEYFSAQGNESSSDAT
jgi:DNA-binding NtrC family response regulator